MTGIRKLTEVSARSINVCAMGFQFGGEPSNPDQATVYADSCEPRVLRVASCGVGPLKADPSSLPSWAVCRIPLGSRKSQISNPVVISDSVDVIQPAGRQVAMDPQPRQDMDGIPTTINAGGEVPLNVPTPDSGADQGLTPRLPPYKYSGVRAVFHGVSKSLNGYIGAGAANQRGRDDLLTPLRAICKISAKALSGSNIDRMRFFFSIKCSKRNRLVSMPNLGLPSPASLLVESRKPPHADRDPAIGGILPRRSDAQVDYAIVVGVAVDVVNDIVGPFAINVKPRKPVSIKELALDAYSPVSLLIDRSRNASKRFVAGLSAKSAAIRAIVQKAGKTGMLKRSIGLFFHEDSITERESCFHLNKMGAV